MVIAYPVRTGLYVNLTNRCPCACEFCLRKNGPGIYGSGDLWLDHEPSVEEVIAAVNLHLQPQPDTHPFFTSVETASLAFLAMFVTISCWKERFATSYCSSLISAAESPCVRDIEVSACTRWSISW